VGRTVEEPTSVRGKAGTDLRSRRSKANVGMATMKTRNLDTRDAVLEETENKTVFAFGVVVGAFVPLLFLALG
jgi:hypothetical protein